MTQTTISGPTSKTNPARKKQYKKPVNKRNMSVNKNAASKATALKHTDAPHQLYAVANTPELNVESELFAIKAKVSIVFTPQRMSIIPLREYSPKDGAEKLYTRYLVAGVTNRGQAIHLVLETVAGMEDEIRLAEKPLFGEEAEAENIYF